MPTMMDDGCWMLILMMLMMMIVVVDAGTAHSK